MLEIVNMLNVFVKFKQGENYEILSSQWAKSNARGG